MKILHVSLGTHQISQQLALQAVASEYLMIDWTTSNDRLPDMLLREADRLQPDLTFMQLQTAGLVDSKTIAQVPGIRVNWTGDVRSPIRSWYKELAPYVDWTLFSNMNDVREFQREGLTASFLDIAFEESIFHREGPILDQAFPVVFCGNNYGDRFPLSRFRQQMIHEVPAINVFGAGWNDRAVADLNGSPETEAAVYRGCEIAINLSHFPYERYSSDRLYRAMACGAFCLCYDFPGLESDFVVGKHLDTWRSISELQQKIDFYQSHAKLRQEIAQAGSSHVWQNHRWIGRIEDLLTLIGRTP